MIIESILTESITNERVEQVCVCLSLSLFILIILFVQPRAMSLPHNVYVVSSACLSLARIQLNLFNPR